MGVSGARVQRKRWTSRLQQGGGSTELVANETKIMGQPSNIGVPQVAPIEASHHVEDPHCADSINLEARISSCSTLYDAWNYTNIKLAHHFTLFDGINVIVRRPSLRVAPRWAIRDADFLFRRGGLLSHRETRCSRITWYVNVHNEEWTATRIGHTWLSHEIIELFGPCYPELAASLLPLPLAKRRLREDPHRDKKS